MEVHAKLRNLHMSPRKVRLVIDAIRGLNVTDAETRLQFIPKMASGPVLKLLRSAIANAEHNFQQKKEDLFVKTVTADGGPTMKRWRARAFGRAAPIRKRTTHIMLVLAPKSERPEDTKKKLKPSERPGRKNRIVKKPVAPKAPVKKPAAPAAAKPAPAESASESSTNTIA